MAPSRKNTNGRSPLVNQQSQITSFFSKPSQSKSQSPLKLKSKSKSKLQSEQNPNSSPSVKSNPNPNPNSSPFVSPITSFSKTSPSQSKLKKKSQSPSQSEQNPNLTPFAKSSPNPNTSPSSSPSASPTTPSPLNGKSKPKTLKPLLIVGLHTSSSYREEAVNRRIRVYWPIDRAWYEGCVKSFDRVSGKHLVEYDDADEELLELSKEKIEFLDGEVKKFRRLRKVSVIDDDNDDDENGIGNESAGGDLSDEDWGINEVNEVADDCSEDLEPEDEEVGSTKKMRGGNGGARKRKVGKGEKADGSKKRKVVTAVGGDGGNTVGIANNGQEAKVIADNVVNVCASERFGSREAEKLPFLGKDRRDAKKRRPGDADYDPRTLYLPPEFLKRLSSGQRQWWEFKSKHMDKVLFFKMGKFYELFEMDAHVGVKELDLQYMKGEQPHCGFPERNFSVNVEKLARKGYRVLVVEQTETPEQLEIRRREEGSKDKVVKREICAVVTKGTLTEGEMLSANPDASYIMSITECCPKSLDKNDVRLYGVCVVDVATSRIIVGQIEDDMECSVLCCLLSELRPAEILKPTKTLSPETERMLTRHTRNPLVNELVPGTEFWDSEKTTRELTSFYSRISDLSQSERADTDNNAQENSNLLPDVLNQLLSSGANLALSALGSVIFYVRQAFLDETLLKYAKYEFLPCSTLRDVFRKPYMVLDAAALENLEIFENSKNGDLMGTLYSQLNHCVTAFGKRLLKSWLARPLFHEHSIRERQDAIAGLKGKNLSFALEFQRELAKLPDMERLIARLFASSEAIGRNANKIVLYEDASKKQLQEFILALRGCETMVQACSSLRSILDDVDSELLHHLLIPGKGLPDISSILEQFRDAFDWNEANNSGRIIPREGVDSEYDSACKKIKDIESNLRKHLKEQQKLLGDRTITYVSVGKEAYLLEIPEKLRSNIPREYELRSSKKGYFRYWTSYIKKMLGELTEAESEKDSKLKSILQTLIRRFCVHHSKWRQLASSVAELDVLISLAIASDYYEGPSCRPIISSVHNPDEAPHLRAKSLGHPILRSDSLGKGTFVPNDITIGGSDCASFLLLTGPNMGGKSTLLRQVCLAVILAQVGADIPAEHFELSLIDRIFVRMGAKDNIMGGQSTFLTELSETASMLTSATRHSLVALDELGRGTATSDGQAIAESVLEYFVRKVQCRGMFSTHYHRLAVDYKRDPKVSLCHMACEVGKGVEGGVEEVTFLYRLNPGACPKSYGVNVARLAGIPDSVLRKAAAKSREFEATCGRRKEASKNGDRGWEEVIAEFIQNLTDVHSGESYQSTSQSRNIDLLNALQHRARILLRQC